MVELKNTIMPEPSVEIEVDVFCEHFSKHNTRSKQDIQKKRLAVEIILMKMKNLYGQKSLKIVIMVMQITIMVQTKRIIVISVLKIETLYHHMK